MAKDNASELTGNPLIDAPNIPTVEALPPATVTEFAMPSISEYKGRYVRSDAPNGEQFALAIDLDAPDGKTHFLLNSVHFDNLSKEEFRQKYEKK